MLPRFTAQLALELAPVRVNLIQAGFVDTAPATSYFADERAVEARRDQLRARLPIGRVVGPADVAALAVHLMINTAVTGATYNIDGGQRLITRLRPPRPAIGRPPFERPARDIRSSARGLAADCGWRQSETRRTCALDVLRGTDAEMPTSHYADTRRTADGSAPYAGPARETRAGDVYVTDGVFLYRIVRVVAGAAADMVELEDCFLLDIVRIPLADLRARRLRVITPAGVRG